MRFVSLLLAGIALSTVTGRVLADEPAAGAPQAGASQVAVQTARAEMDAGNFVTACAGFKAAYRDDPRASTLYWIATCYDKWGRIATAAVHYDDYLNAFGQLSDLEQKAERDNEEAASARRQELEKRLPKVILRVPRDAPGTTRVLRKPLDGGPLVQLAIGVPLPIDPGEHVLTTEIPGRPSAFTKFSIKEKENQVVNVVMPPATESGDPTKRAKPLQPVPSMMPALDQGISGRRVAAYTLGGVGAVGILGGIVTGVITWAQKEPIATNCLGRVCNPIGESAKDTAAITEVVSSVAFPVGAAALAAGVILYLTEPPPSKFGSTEPRLRLNATASPSRAGVELDWSF
ncbi:hypothetical protein [Polyangium sp. 6x1]|uniref:tetratricopeptide repeat protein n=1 Tax=Polyangium sp. 6x1 TaxID=3042689 RepID=UPI0024828DB5|nr:hypothetical protein [Polyangium sp. 6x1]MDI1450418.1 hypothetical protein [Polyangium sp. 6x1]